MSLPKPDASPVRVGPSSVARVGLALAVAAPLAVTLVIGLTHPMSLYSVTAAWWRNLHIILLPVFPLIGVGPWLASRRSARPWRWIAGFGGFLFAVYYTALDALAGIAAGSVQLAGHPEAKSSLYALANIFGPVGAFGLAVAWAAATIGVMRATGVRAVTGGLAVVGALLVWKSHVYFPVGTLGLALLLAGGIVLAVLSTTPKAAVAD
ncbi:MAG: hypothetical protein M3N46_14060 [Actinomycetota bacterium]|nr:hypothetical protein [Actinomycetota bacterium]